MYFAGRIKHPLSPSPLPLLVDFGEWYPRLEKSTVSQAMLTEGGKHPFRWLPSLQHMACVKIIETLWRNFEDKDLVITACEKTCVNYTYAGWTPRGASIINKIGGTVDELSLPKSIKISLKSFLLPMVARATKWLVETGTDVALRPREDWLEIITYLVNNFCWSNFGYVDGGKMFKAYVANKETIDFGIWEQLCFYCVEDDIIRFAKTIDWDNCREFYRSHYPIYWYWKIYGKFPTEEMFISPFYLDFKNLLDQGFYDKENILGTMFKYSVSWELRLDQMERTYISAMKYFWNCVKDDARVAQFILEALCGQPSTEGSVYLLTVMQEETLLDGIITTFKIHNRTHLLRWPWILFIDDWIRAFEVVDASFFLRFFSNMETKKRDNEGFNEKTLYEPFLKVWRIFHDRFSSEDEIVNQAFWRILERKDYILCRIMLDGMAIHLKENFLYCLKDYAKFKSHSKFCLQFTEQVMNEIDENEFM
ncbi:uncharacterized protein LOC135166731 isoform X2 [Diachasmimorpha longicaudata]|uniref:uncharacterized protein LOC135166731 isoform X2 n=1 Tax=Diachasmimorpha longicaudata TaxID=58733 RepID=UPI0030B8767C